MYEAVNFMYKLPLLKSSHFRLLFLPNANTLKSVPVSYWIFFFAVSQFTRDAAH